MPIPVKTSVFWAAYKLLDRRPVMQQPADKVRAAAEKRKKMLRLPGASLLVGRPDPSVRIEDTSFPREDGTEIGLRVYRPAGDAVRPVVVNFHGGGWVSGDVRQSEWWCAGVAAQAGVVVVSVEYRLAPEHPFPVPLDDCFAATQWVASHAAQLGVDAGRLAVMGDSAGGNLAAAVALRARDEGGPAIGLQVLIYPSVDLQAELPSRDENAHAPVLNRKDLDVCWHHYATETQAKDPYVSPLYGDHRGLPPALIQTAQYDPLRDHGPLYAAALREAGVPVRLTNYVDAVHGYISLPTVTVGAKQALGETATVLRETFGT